MSLHLPVNSARDEKFKLQDQKKDYRKKIQTIWKRQIAALSTDASEKAGADGEGPEGTGGAPEADNRGSSQEQKKAEAAKDDDSGDSDFEDDDLVAEIEVRWPSRSVKCSLTVAQTPRF